MCVGFERAGVSDVRGAQGREFRHLVELAWQPREDNCGVRVRTCEINGGIQYWVHTDRFRTTTAPSHRSCDARRWFCFVVGGPDRSLSNGFPGSFDHGVTGGIVSDGCARAITPVTP